MKTTRQQMTADMVAGNGLLHRRALLRRGLAFAGALGTGAGFSTGAAAEPLTEPDWSRVPSDARPPYQVHYSFEKSVVRLIDNPNSQPVISHARTPHHLLNGIITPNGLHFNVNHGGVPAIDPSRHKLLIHGMVKRPLVFGRGAAAISDGVPHQFPGVRWQQRVTVLERTGPGDCTAGPWLRVVLGLGRFVREQ